MSLYKKKQKSKSLEQSHYEANTSIKERDLDNDGSVVRVKSHAGISLYNTQ
jgi:hypothetical protein